MILLALVIVSVAFSAEPEYSPATFYNGALAYVFNAWLAVVIFIVGTLVYEERRSASRKQRAAKYFKVVLESQMKAWTRLCEELQSNDRRSRSTDSCLYLDCNHVVAAIDGILDRVLSDKDFVVDVDSGKAGHVHSLKAQCEQLKEEGLSTDEAVKAHFFQQAEAFTRIGESLAMLTKD